MVINCNLIHADFSEYNLLYLNGKVWVIDVSQSVEKDHPYAFEFLKRDIHNINIYYNKLGLSTFKIKSFFNFVSDPKLAPENEDEEIEKMMNEAMENPDLPNELSEFLLFEIPRSLSMYEDLDEINAQLEAIKSNIDTLIFGRFLGTDERILKGIIYEDEEGEEGEELTEVELEAVFEKQLEEKEMKKEMKATLPPKPKKLPDPFEGMDKTERQKLVKE